MRNLLYAIFRGPLPPGLKLPAGVAGQPVEVVEHQGLGAAVSELAEAEAPAEVPGILAYGTVVEFFFRHLTVIPLRYGAMAGDRREVTALLERHQAEYAALLAELDGMAEMGVEVLSEGCAGAATTAAIAPARSPDSAPSGASYLSGRKLYYRSADRMVERDSELVEEISASLAGLFVRRKVERPSRDRLLRLYFLVPRPAVECFRRTSRQGSRNQPVKLLLSGPWPPYNFVDSNPGSAIL
jgi:hypothetical protein